MSDFFQRVRDLISAGEVRISEHGYDELVEHGLTAREILAGILTSVVVEEYPDYPKGPCVLLLQKDCAGNPVHVVWVSRTGMTSRLFWSRHTGRTRIAGMSIS